MNSLSNAIAFDVNQLVRTSIAIALAVVLTIGSMVGCAVQRPVEVVDSPPTAGALFEATRIRRYPAWYLRLGLWLADVPGDIDVNVGITLYRIGYWTRDPRADLVRASALVGVPDGSSRAVVGYLHGTQTDREVGPSAPSTEGRLVAAVFAGAGYLLVAPDYQGFGRFIGPHPFLHAETVANASIDALRAARQLVEGLGVTLPATLFLAGASQGGHGVLATHRALGKGNGNGSSVGLELRATASVSGPYDLAGISFPHALDGQANSHPVYLGYLVDSYSRLYEQPRASVLRNTYAELVIELYDGHHDNNAIDERLPDAPREMFRAEFLAAHDAGSATWFHEALAVNSVHDWVPGQPIRLYFGSADRDVAPREATATAARMSSAGAPVQAVNLGHLDHDASGLASVAAIRNWFDELSR